MFEGLEFPKSLDEQVFNSWLEKGRESKIGYLYLLVIWDEFESQYEPVYIQERSEIDAYRNSKSREKLIAAYDLYSESRII